MSGYRETLGDEVAEAKREVVVPAAGEVVL